MCIRDRVLFGRARSQLSPLETVELATSLAALAGGGGFDVIGNLREIVRLDRLVFANTASGEISIAGGKYLSRQVYIELISEGTQGISTNVEWRPKPVSYTHLDVYKRQVQGKARVSGNDNNTEISNITLNGAGINAVGSANFIKGKPPIADFAFIIGKGLVLRLSLIHI